MSQNAELLQDNKLSPESIPFDTRFPQTEDVINESLDDDKLEDVEAKEDVKVKKNQKVKPEDLVEWLPEWAEVTYKEWHALNTKEEGMQEAIVVVRLWDETKEISVIVEVEESIDKKSKRYIKQHLYINWKSASELKVEPKHGSGDLYSITFENDFNEWKKPITIDLKVIRANNRTSMKFISYSYDAPDKPGKLGNLNTLIEVDSNTHNLYEVVMDENWNRMNFSIVYNEYETKKYIEKLIKNKKLKNIPQFENRDEFENTQLGWSQQPKIKVKDENWNYLVKVKDKEWKLMDEVDLWWRIEWLNNPELWKEVAEDDNGYYRTLYYSANWKKFDVTKVYFTPNWEFDVKTTAEKKSEFKILWISVDYEITENQTSKNLEFKISDKSKKELEKKVKNDRKVLIKTFNSDELVADSWIFTGLNKQEKTKNNTMTWQFNTEIICLEPISWMYKLYLNIEWKFAPLYCRVEWSKVILLDETWKEREEVYFNYDKHNRFKMFKEGGKITINPIKNELNNPTEKLPKYHENWDITARKLLEKPGNLTNFDGGYLNYFDNKWSLIAKMPFDKTEDWGYEFNNEKYHTKVEALKLYKYHGFKTLTDKIKEKSSDLWIADADIRNIFEQSLKNKKLDFNRKAVEITDPDTWESIYYNIDSSFKITIDKNLYDTAEDCLTLMLHRLESAQKINRGKAIYQNIRPRKENEYDDFERFVWWEYGFWKQIASPKQLEELISGKNNEMPIKLSWWKWESIEVVYEADNNWWVKGKLRSWEESWEVTIKNQAYTIETNIKGKKIKLWKGVEDKIDYTTEEGDIMFTPKKERK